MAASHERVLRIGTLLTSALATPLLITLTVISLEYGSWWYSHRKVTTFCFGYIPLAMTAVASAISLQHNRKHKRAPGPRHAMLDGLAGITYLSILIPIWAIEIGELELPGYALLAGYMTAPMIVNMFVHFYIFAYNARAIFSSFASPQVHECPNCHNNFTVGGAPKVQETSKSGERYNLLRGEDYLDADADAEAYIDASARPSEETMRPEGDEADDVESKGKTIIEV